MPLTFLGIDPGLRNTGLALLDPEGEVVDLDQVATPVDRARSVIRALHGQGNGVTRFMLRHDLGREDYVLGFEQQANQGKLNSWLMMVIQVHLLWTVDAIRRPARAVMPYPSQLRAFMRRHERVAPGVGSRDLTKTQVVNHFRRHVWEASELRGRLSNHKVDAYYAARIARAVHRGEWRFDQKPLVPPLVDWRTRDAAA